MHYTYVTHLYVEIVLKTYVFIAMSVCICVCVGLRYKTRETLKLINIYWRVKHLSTITIIIVHKVLTPSSSYWGQLRSFCSVENNQALTALGVEKSSPNTLSKEHTSFSSFVIVFTAPGDRVV